MTVWTWSSGSASSGPAPVKWFSRFSDQEGFALFFLPVGTEEFWCNFTLGESLLASRRVAPLQWRGDQPGASALQPGTQMIDADR